MSRMSPSDLDGARCCVRPEYSGIPAEDLEQVVEQSLSGLPGDTGRIFSKPLGPSAKRSEARCRKRLQEFCRARLKAPQSEDRGAH